MPRGLEVDAFFAGFSRLVAEAFERGALREGQLDCCLVRLTCADDAVVLPHRYAAPLPLLDDGWIRLLDKHADTGERLAAPVAEFTDPPIDERGGQRAIA